MIDSSSKIANGRGLVELNVRWLGSPSTCENVRSSHFDTHFCWLKLLKQDIEIDYCLPRTCEESYFNDLLFTFKDLSNYFEMEFPIPIDKIVCMETFEKFEDDKATRITINVFAAWLVIIICLTMIDIYKQRKTENPLRNSESWENLTIIDGNEIETQPLNEPTIFPADTIYELSLLRKISYCCSIPRNFQNLFNRKQKDPLHCIHGIKTLAFCFIIWGHIIIKLALTSDNLLRYYEMYENSPSTSNIIYNGYVNSINTFFIISGILMTYFYLNSHQARKAGWTQFYLKRILRLSPTYVVILLLYAQIYVKAPNRNYDAYLQDMVNNCAQTWWKDILYISNFFENECVEVAWYIACSMQLYFISPLVLIAIQRYSKSKTVYALSTALISSVLITFTIAYINELPIEIYRDILYKVKQQDPTYFNSIFIKPYTRVKPFIFGIGLGWFLFEVKCKARIKKVSVMLLWLLTLACFYLSFFFVRDFKVGIFGSSVWFAIHDIVWSLGLSILIFLCCSGYGGIISRFLNWQGWIVFSKLSFSCFLFHIYAIEIFNQTIGDNHFLQIYSIMYYPIIFQFVYFGGLILHLLIEAPTANLCLMFKTNGTKKIS